MGLYETATANALGYKDVTPRQVREGRAGERLIDVREPHEFNAELGHIAGAELVPFHALPAAAAGWRLDGDVVLICRSGGRSARAARVLITMGFRRVMNLTGGMLAHVEAGLPVERT